MARFIGIEIGGTKLQLVAGDAGGRIIDRRRFVVEKVRGGEGIREQIAHALPELIAAHQPIAIGVGFGGPVDHESGRIATSHQIAGWSGFELGEWLHEQSALPAQIDNDANVAALGEAQAGAGRNLNPVFYVTMGSGVGGGLVVDGKIYHGARPGESEIGHVRLDKSGTIVEQRCSGWAVDQRIREAIAQEPGSELARLVRDSVLPAASRQKLGDDLAMAVKTIPDAINDAGARATDCRQAADNTLPTGGEARWLAPALAADDSLARRILDEVAEDLAFALSHVVQLMHPSTIVLGGGLSLIGEPLRFAVAQHLRRFIMEVFGEGPSVQLAALGEDAVPIGALLLAASA
ncbi:ROK family protein [bacterium]|nr:ROK family protein [bacterium]